MQARLAFQPSGALAEIEHEVARERTMVRLRAARKRGWMGGRPPSLAEDDMPRVQPLANNPDVSKGQICEQLDAQMPTLDLYVRPKGKRRT